MSEVQYALTRLLDLAEADEKQGHWADDYDAAFHELSRCIRNRRQLPILTHLGFTRDGVTCPRRVTFADGQVLWHVSDKPGPHRLRILLMDTLRRRSIESRAKAGVGPPYRFVVYGGTQQELWSCDLPTLPPPGHYRLKDPVDCSPFIFTEVKISQYRHGYAGEGLAVVAWHGRGPSDYAALSVNLGPGTTQLPPGHFHLKHWSENEDLANAFVESGVIQLTGRFQAAGYTQPVEAYIDWRKFIDLPYVEYKPTMGAPDARDQGKRGTVPQAR